MKIAVVISNGTMFPKYTDGHNFVNYGGYSRFYEGLCSGFPKNVNFYMIGVKIKQGNFVKNVVEVPGGKSRDSYLQDVYEALKKLSPDFVIIQNPVLASNTIVANFRHLCRVGGYKYGGHLKSNVRYVTISNWGNRHYGKNWPVIYQTCSPLDVEYQEEKEDYFLFISNLTRAFAEKGLEYACKFAHKQKMRLLIAGPIGNVSKSLDRMKSLETDYVKYIGPIAGQKKKELIGKAKSIFYPIDKKCKEMAGTIFVEAAFSGTPVISTNIGSVPEYVKHGTTGFVCNNEGDFIEAVEKIDAISSKDCLVWAKKKFDQKMIASQYLKLIKGRL